MDNDVDALKAFFSLVYGVNTTGYVCLAFSPDLKDWREAYYEWPRDFGKMVEAITRSRRIENVYYCPQILDKPKRKKDNVKTCPSIWADLDTCGPERLLVPASLVVESSPGRFQAVWSLEEPMVPSEAENVSLRIAYYHAGHGADRSGWDLSQLLRVPGTYNFKPEYTSPGATPPKVVLRAARQSKFRLADFADYPLVQGTKELMLPLPESILTEEPLDIIQRYRNRIDPRVFGLYSTEPEKDWSGRLWKLLMACFEAGMTREEVYAIALQAACNKYARDNKPPEYLWRDICRGWLRNEENNSAVVARSELKPLLVAGEAADEDGFVERYIKWASSLGDAAPQYHQAGAFVILSSLLSGNVRIPTSWGNILPNLWFMILADTTITRKSTAMDMAMELVNEVDEDALMATDGSVEGLLTALSLRPGRPSVFLRDEFSGMIEMMTKRDYLAGMMEVFTKLYDGKTEKRLLRKEVITITKPVLILFTGGIKTKIQQLLSFEHVGSGFIPRFLFLTAVSDVTRVRPLGPPSARNLGERDSILDEMRDMADYYQAVVPMEVRSTGMKLPKPRLFDSELSPKAWERYNQLEGDLMKAGLATERPELMVPLYSRLSISTLKAAALIAASSQRGETVQVEERHLIRAIEFAQGWREYANDVVNGIGKNAAERDLERVLNTIAGNPGIARSRLMQSFHLTARAADAIFSTLEQRGQITGTRQGRGTVYHAIGS
jgi:hypothetical protein